MSNGRLSGVALSWNRERRFGIVQSENRRFLALSDDIQSDALGRRFLLPNEPVEFQAGEPKTDGKYSNALQVVPLCRQPESADLSTHREYARVYKWEHSYGFAMRESNDPLYVHISQFITEGASTLNAGDLIWTRIAPPDKGRNWSAVSICALEPDEQGGLRVQPFLPGHENDLELETEPTAFGVALVEAIACNKQSSFVEQHRGARLRDIPR